MDQLELIHKNLRPLRIDAIPAETATEILTTGGSPGKKISGAFRRTCNYARWNYYTSTNIPKPLEVKLARRFSTWPIDKLRKHLRRVMHRMIIARGHISRIPTEFMRTQAIDITLMPLIAKGRALIAEIQRRAPAKDVNAR